MDGAGLGWSDFSSHFYASPSLLGSNRAELSATRLAELNPYVPITAVAKPTSDIDASLVGKFQCLLLVNAAESEVRRVNALCHAANVGFILAESRGAFCRVFVDLGSAFEVVDKNGEESLEAMVGKISLGPNASVATVANKRHGLETGDWVKFSEVEGMTEINGKAYQITGKSTEVK